MKKLLLFLACSISLAAMAQDKSKTKTKKKIDLSTRANDHIMIQFGGTQWQGMPDTIHHKGFSKTFNAYAMLDFPFKTSPKISVAIGPGIGTDHIMFTKTLIGIKEKTASIHFSNEQDTNYYKKTALTTAYLEAPVELRYSSNPVTGNGLKVALGFKVGTLINAHTRNVKFSDKSGVLINNYVLKEESKYFFNKTRFSFMARAGYGHFTVFFSYQLNPVFKTGLGPDVKPMTIGLTLSGL